jgi:hypothetical protein
MLLYYNYTKQALRVADVMAEPCHARGFDLQQATTKFADSLYAERFSGSLCDIRTPTFSVCPRHNSGAATAYVVREHRA